VSDDDYRTEPPQASAQSDADDPKKHLAKVISGLEHARNVQRVLAIVFGLLAIVFALKGVAFLADQATKGVDTIRRTAVASAEDEISDTAVTATTAYLIVRGTGLAAVVGGAIYFLLNLARSSIDQSTRYEKRLIASHLINYALHEEGIDAAKLQAAHEIVAVWGSTVESAYTPPRVAKQVGKLELGVGKDGASYKSESNAV
jgi:hypothetical protein